MAGEGVFQVRTPRDLNRTHLTYVLRRGLGEPDLRVRSFSCRRLRAAGPGIGLWRLEARYDLPTGSGLAPLVLKISPRREGNEVPFYREIACRLPVHTPRLYHSFLDEGDRTWLFLKEIAGGKSPLSWEPGDYRLVVQDLAGLHAACWGGEGLERYPWLPQPTARDLDRQVRAGLTAADRVERWGWPRLLPDVIDRRRLRAMRRLLADAGRVVQPMNDAGLTLVHGDLWPGNVRVLADGRRVFSEWQGVALAPAAWELHCFLDLALIAEPCRLRPRRDVPVGWEEMVAWYVEAFGRLLGDRFDEGRFRDALAYAVIWQGLSRWLPRLAGLERSAPVLLAGRVLLGRRPQPFRALALLTGYGQGLAFLAGLFREWEETARSLFGDGLLE